MMNILPVGVIPASCWPESLLIILGKMPAHKSATHYLTLLFFSRNCLNSQSLLSPQPAHFGLSLFSWKGLLKVSKVVMDF